VGMNPAHIKSETASSGRRPTKKLLTAVAALLLAALAWLGLNRISNNPRDEFRKSVLRQCDLLITALKDLQPGHAARSERVLAVTGDAGSRNLKGATGQWETPLAFTIVDFSKSVVEQFQAVPLPFYLQGTNGLDNWGRSFKVEYGKRCTIISSEVARIKEDYRRDPNAFRTTWTASVGLTDKGALYFDDHGQRGYVIESMLSVDIDAWIASLKKLQKPEADK